MKVVRSGQICAAYLLPWAGQVIPTGDPDTFWLGLTCLCGSVPLRWVGIDQLLAAGCLTQVTSRYRVAAVEVLQPHARQRLNGQRRSR